MTDVVEVDSATVWPEDAMEVEEGIVSTWFVHDGGHVEAGSTLCEIQIEKVSVDVPAPVSGTVAEILVEERGEFARGEALARIESV